VGIAVDPFLGELLAPVQGLLEHVERTPGGVAAAESLADLIVRGVKSDSIRLLMPQ
jgi:hypothetical protein